MYKKIRKNYMFSDKTHSMQGVFASVCGLIGMVTLVCIVLLSYYNEGSALLSWAFAALLTSIVSIVGVVNSLLCIGNEEVFHFYGWLGLLLNVLTMLGVGSIVYLGI